MKLSGFFLLKLVLGRQTMPLNIFEYQNYAD